MTASGQRKKNRKLRREKSTQINNQKKLDELKKQRKNVQYDSRGNKKDTKPKLISNIGKNADYGQRQGKIGNLPSDYKKTEKKAFKKAETFKKKQAKDKLKIKKEKERKTTTGSKTTTGKGVRDRFVRYKGKMYRRGTPMAKKAEAAEAARKKLGAKGYMRR